jgi:hypothetical protein
MIETPFQRAYVCGYNDAVADKPRSARMSKAFQDVLKSLPDHARTAIPVLKDMVTSYYAGFASVDEITREAVHFAYQMRADAH